MQLKTSRYRMEKRKTALLKVNWLHVFFLILGLGALYVIDTQIRPSIKPLFIPTPTPTRTAASFAGDAAQLFQEGKLKSSIDMYTNAIQTDPTNADLYIALSRVQVFYHDFPSALNNAQNAILRAKSAMAFAVYGWALYSSDQLDSAQKELTVSLSMDPNLGLTHAYLAIVLIDTDSNNYTQAKQEAHTALALSPNLLESHMAMGYVYYQTGNYTEAISEYQAAIAINSKLADLYLPLGDIYNYQNDSTDARAAYTNAMTYDQNNPVYMARMARSYSKDGEFGKAQQYAEQAVQVDPLGPQYHGLLGVMRYKNKDYLNAVSELELAVRGGQVNSGAIQGLPLSYGTVEEYYWTYGLALAHLDRCSDALPVFTMLEQAVPNDDLAQENVTGGLLLCKVITPTPTLKSNP